MVTMHRAPYRYMLRQLQAARKEAGLTQVQVAELFKTTQTFISKVERGERRIDPVELSEFAALYDKEINHFLLKALSPTGEGGPTKPEVEKRVLLRQNAAQVLSQAATDRHLSESELIAEAVRAYFLDVD